VAHSTCAKGQQVHSVAHSTCAKGQQAHSVASFWLLSWNMRASRAAATRLLAAVIAWMSPARPQSSTLIRAPKPHAPKPHAHTWRLPNPMHIHGGSQTPCSNICGGFQTQCSNICVVFGYLCSFQLLDNYAAFGYLYSERWLLPVRCVLNSG